MPWLTKLLQGLGVKHNEGRLPLINPAIPRKQLWTFIGLYAVIGAILAILHHTVAPWL